MLNFVLPWQIENIDQSNLPLLNNITEKQTSQYKYTCMTEGTFSTKAFIDKLYHFK